MHPQRLFKDIETVLQDMADLNDILGDLNEACAKFYYVNGMTDITKDLCTAFYKLRIKILEMGVDQIEIRKESNDVVNSMTDMIISLGNVQAELETAKESYNYFLQTGKIREE
jgi:hypothetical protein